MNSNIYLLQLENDKYYIGKTNNINSRILQHFSNNGSKWTRIYKPIKVLKTYDDNDIFSEEKYTLLAIDKYGIDNVRGGSFTKQYPTKNEKEYIIRQIRSIKDVCFKCGKKGHFAKNCDIYNQHNKKHIITNIQGWLIFYEKMMINYIDAICSNDEGIKLKEFITIYGEPISLGGNDEGEFISRKVNNQYSHKGEKRALSIDFEFVRGWSKELIEYCRKHNYKLRNDNIMTIYGNWLNDDDEWIIKEELQCGMRTSLNATMGGALEHLTLNYVEGKMYIVFGYYYIH